MSVGKSELGHSSLPLSADLSGQELQDLVRNSSQEGALAKGGSAFSSRAEAKQKFSEAQLASRNYVFTVLSALCDPTGKNPPPFLSSIGSALQNGLSLEQSVAKLNDAEKSALQKSISPDTLEKLFSLSHEPQKEILLTGLLDLGRGLKSDQELDAAGQIFHLLQQEQDPVSPFAKQELDAIQGRGSFGRRFEFHVQSFAKDATDYHTIAPMFAGTALASMVKTFTLGKFVGMGEAWFSRGYGAKAVSGLLAFAAEVPTFALGSRFLRKLDGKSGEEPSVSNELLGAAITLGFLKFAGMAGQEAFAQLHGVNELGMATRLGTLTKVTQPVIGQTAMFGGMLLGHKAEEKIGLREHIDDATTLTDTLSSMLSMGVGAHLGEKALGHGYARLHQEMELRTRANESLLQSKSVIPLWKNIKKGASDLALETTLLTLGIFGVGGGGGLGEISGAASSPKPKSRLPKNIGEVLLKTRDLFVAHGYSEARVSLREVKRIKAYLETFGESQGMARATANALWLTLGASLPKEQRDGKLGQNLHRLILKVEIPGIKAAAFESELERSIQAKPAEFDPAKSADENLWQTAVAQDPVFKNFSTRVLFDFRISMSDHLRGDDWNDLVREVKDLRVLKNIHSGYISEALGKIGQNSNLDLAQLETLIQAVKDFVRMDDSRPDLYCQAKAFGEIGQNSNLDSAQLETLIQVVRDSEEMTAFKTVALSGIGQNSNLDSVQLDKLIQMVKGLGETPNLNAIAFGEISQNSNLSPVQLETLIQMVKDSGAPPSDEINALGLIGRNPNLGGAQLQALIHTVKDSRTKPNTKVEALGLIGGNPNLDVPQFQALIQAVEDSEAEPDRKAEAFGGIGQNPNLDASQVENLIQAVKDSRIPSVYKVNVLGMMGRNPNFDAGQLQTLFQMAKDSGAASEEQVEAFGGIGQNPNLTSVQLETLIQIIKFSWAEGKYIVKGLAGIGQNSRLSSKSYRELMEEICRLSTNEYIDSLQANSSPHAKAYRDEIFQRYQAIQGRVEKLKQVTLDSAARISETKGDETDLAANLSVLAGIVGAAPRGLPGEGKNRGLSLLEDPDFDSSLVSAHQLLNRLTQALAINRFALLSGPPASGKSEAGRYLGKLLGWETAIFNCHRGITQEDLMQRVGVVANGKTSFTITDGPLADALIHGKLFILNEINLAKPGSLSFLFSILADVNQTFDYYNPETGKTEKREIHPNFRMVATQNPEGPGRKDLNAALKNRAIEIDAPVYSDIELTALLRGKNPKLRSDLPTNLVRFYQDLASKMRARAMGEHAEGYVWNLRHLMRLSEGFAGREKLTPQEILAIFYEKVGISLTPKDRAVFFDAVQNYEYQGVKISETDVQRFVGTIHELPLRSVYAEFNIDSKQAQTLAKKHGIVDIPTSARFLKAILQSLRDGYHPWLKGPAGTGKTKLANFAAELLGAKVYSDTLTPQTDESQLKGELKPTAVILDDGSRRLGFKNVPSALVKALQDSSGQLIACILDEAGFAKSDVLEELNTLLDRDGGIWTTDQHGKSQFLERPKNFRLILASNTYDYQGVNLQSEAFRSRMQEIFMDFEFGEGEIVKLLQDTKQDTFTLPQFAHQRSLAKALLAARRLFTGEGYSEARVSLREVQRIKSYLDTFEASQGASRATANALWLTLGASLPKEQREGELGKKLRKAMLEVEIPDVPAERFQADLDAVIQAKPVEFDPKQKSVEILMGHAFRGSIGQNLHGFNLAEALRTLEPDLASQLLAAQSESQHGVWRKTIAESLGRLIESSREHPEALNRILSTLEKMTEDEDIHVLESVMEALESLVEVFKEDKEKSKQILKFLNNPNIRIGVGSFISRIYRRLIDNFQGDNALLMEIFALLKLVGDNFSVRFENAESLRVLSSHLEEPYRSEALSNALKIYQKVDQKWYWETQVNTAEGRGRLSLHLETDQGAEVLSQAIRDLGELCTEHSIIPAADALARLSQILPKAQKVVLLNQALLALRKARSTRETFIERRSLPLSMANLSDLLEGGQKFEILSEALGILRELSDDKDPNSLCYVLSVLGEIAGSLKKDPRTMSKALTLLNTLSNSDNWLVRLRSAEAKARFSEQQVEGEVKCKLLSQSITSLEDLSLDPEKKSRRYVAESLLDLVGPVLENEDALIKCETILRRLLQDPEREVQTEAAQTLSAFAARYPELRARLTDEFAPYVARYHELKKSSVDSLAKISEAKGDVTDLPKNLEVLGKKLEKNPAMLRAHEDFDPSLVSAHQLLDRLTQALAINRFALLSGPPASGKSEVGRYLGKTLDWETLIFNCHRGITSEDLMQRVGVVANGKTSFTITDGPLADALLHGKLFILNEINLAKPGSLSFLFSVLADVNQTFDYYNPETGKTEKRPIHPNFRMVATQNSEGPGRKDLNVALKNRAVEIHAPAYGDIELSALLRGKYPNLSADLPNNLVRFYQDLSAKMRARAMGEHAEGYVWNLRHLMRLAEGFAGEGAKTPKQILETFYDKIGVSLLPKDREVFFDAVRNYEYQGVKISEADVHRFVGAIHELPLRSVYAEFNIDPKQAQTLAKKHGIVDIPTSARFLRAILQSLRDGYHPWLKGPAGTGKTKLANFAAELLSAKVYNDTLTPQTDEAQLKGELKPTVVTLEDGSKRLGFKNVPSSLVNALKDPAESLVACILDEAGFAKPDVLEELNTLLDRDGGIWVVDNIGKSQFLSRSKNFRLILASNTYDYQGVNLQSEAFRSRTQEIFMDFEFKPEEIAELLKTSADKSSLLSQASFTQSLGKTLSEVRDLFIAHGYSEARVSLREVQRIKTYLETFAESQGLARATANALWLTLGAGLPKEQLDGELGQKLRWLILKAKIPGIEAKAFEFELDRSIQVKPVEFDPAKSGQENLWEMAAAKDPVFKNFSAWQLLKYRSVMSDLFGRDECDELIQAVKDSVAEPNTKFKAFSRIGLNSHLNAVQLQTLLQEMQGCCHDDPVYCKFNWNLDVEAIQLKLMIQAVKDSGIESCSKAGVYGDIGQNSNLDGVQFHTLIQAAENLDLRLTYKTGAYGIIGRNFNLSAAQFQTLIQLVKDSGTEPYPKVAAFGRIGQSPNLDGPKFQTLIQAVKDSEATPYAKAEVYGDIGQNSNLDGAQLELLIQAVKDSGVESDYKIEALGRIGRNFNLHAVQLQTLIQAVKDSGADPYVKIKAFGRIGQNPNLDGYQLQTLIQVVKDSKAVSNHKITALGLIGRNPNLDEAQLQTLIQAVIQAVQDPKAKSHDEVKVRSFGWIVSNPNLHMVQLQTLIQTVKDSPVFPINKSEAFASIVQNSNLSSQLYRELMEEISILSTDEYIQSLQANFSPHAKAYRDEIFRHYQSTKARVEELKMVSVDSAKRISEAKGDETDLKANLGVLAGIVGAAPLGRPGEGKHGGLPLPVDQDFDPSLVSAHQLLNRLTQALAINRFVLLSGPPASGKSEVGRYLGKVLDWETSIFNCHRAVTSEELMQRVGVVANGKTSFTITDGPLADALLHGKLFILNEINLAKPGSLSFLFSILADVNQTFDYYNPETGNTEKRRIHPNFRMVATQNPEGPGRKDLNAALKNRAIEIDAPAYSDLELTALLRGKYSKLSSDLPTNLVRFYQDLTSKMRVRAMGEHAEGYVWNLRHLMRLAEGFGGREKLNPQEILGIFYGKVGVSLTPKDRSIFFDAVRNYEYQGVKISEKDVAEFQTRIGKEKLAEVVQEFGIDPRQTQALAMQHGVVDIPTSARFLKAILQSLRDGYHPWLKGPAGTGKTKLANFAAELLGAKIYNDTLTPQTDEAQLKGELKPTVVTLDDGSKRLGFKNVPSALVNALKDPAERLVVCILDEAGFAKPDILEELNTLLDRDGGIWVVDNAGKSQFLPRQKNFRLILASNTYDYQGVNLQSEALRSRTQEIFMDFEFSAGELNQLFNPQQDHKAPPPSASGSGLGEATGSLSVKPSSPGKTISRHSTLPGGIFGYGIKPESDDAAPKLSRIPPSQAILKMRESTVREKLAGSKIPEETIARLEARFEKLKSRLLGAAAAMGRTGDLRIEFDPSQETFAMTLDEPRVFHVGPRFLMELSTEDLINNAVHEGAHADISRIGTGEFFKNEKLRALLNVVEDLRVDARAMDRMPGRKESYARFLNEFYYEEPKKLLAKGKPRMFPHEAFLDAVMNHAYGPDSPWDADPLVGPALQEAWPLVQKAMAERPMVDNPSEVEVQRHFAHFEKVLKEEILPIYDRLYQDSLKQAEAMLQQQASAKSAQGAGQGQGMRGGSTIDPKDLSDAAKKLLEERAKEIADAHAPKGTLGDRQEKARKIYGEGSEQKKDKAKPTTDKKTPDGLGDFLQGRHEDWRRHQGELATRAYSKALDPLKDLPDRVFRVFDQHLKPNTDFEFEGHFIGGPKIDVARAIKAIEGMLTNLKVFKRKTEPTAKDYRFSLLLDASGSMADGGARERGGLGLGAMFVDVFERLDIPYSMDAFHNGYIPLKGFSDRLKAVPERNAFFNHMVLNTWGQGMTNLRAGIRGSLDRIQKEQQRDKRDVEFLFVLTDGEETHGEGPEIRTLCEQAAKQGIIVVGIGIGEGMQTVREHFPIHLTEPNPERLPQLLAEFIKEYVKKQSIED